ncbi:hypothetical protein ACMD2_12233 [Ananas comosus]|uniref:Uncharacterized protein n=1 Tax=Ananas comosus TaxID=4615 RepID=A0A199UDA9_ANACO|nr:hypothetical protein ACMD2_12233 [Ananas comosus]
MRANFLVGLGRPRYVPYLIFLLTSLSMIIGLSTLYKHFRRCNKISSPASFPSPSPPASEFAGKETKIGSEVFAKAKTADNASDLDVERKRSETSAKGYMDLNGARPPKVELLGEFALTGATSSKTSSVQRLQGRGADSSAESPLSQKRSSARNNTLNESSASAESNTSKSSSVPKTQRKEARERGDIAKMETATTPLRRSSRLRNRNLMEIQIKSPPSEPEYMSISTDNLSLLVVIKPTPPHDNKRQIGHHLTRATGAVRFPNPELVLILIAAELLPQPPREELASVHAEIDGGGERHEERRVGHAGDVAHPDLHGGPAHLPLPLDRAPHHEPPAARRPRSRHVALRQVDGEFAPAPHAQHRLGQPDRRAGAGADPGAGAGEEVEAVAEGVDGAAVAPGLEPAPRLPVGAGAVGAGGGAEDEPRARVGAGDAVGAPGGHERGHHRRRRHGRPRQVVDRHRPSLALLHPTL